jgi:hypothetical protein
MDITNINEEFLKQTKELTKILNTQTPVTPPFLFIGKKVMVRTRTLEYWFGTLVEKTNEEIILADARHMVDCYPLHGVTMLDCANFGITPNSKAVAPLQHAWLTASAMFLCTKEAVEMLENAEMPIQG